MKKEIKKKGIYILISLIFIILLISTVSAEGFWDWFKKTITGKAATTGEFNTSITFSGINPISNIKVWNATLTSLTPKETGTLNISFNVSITDEDGASDINDSSVKVEFTFGSSKTIKNTTACSEISGESNSSTQNYSCSIQMWYYNAPGTWTINVSANDLGNKNYYENSSMNFTYNTLQGIVIGPVTIGWPASNPGDTNVISTHNTTVNNTGNYNCTNLSITGVHPYGDTGSFLEVANFTSSINSTTADTCDHGDSLINGTAQQIFAANVTAGNYSLNDGKTAQEILYYCINEVPTGLASQEYSTSKTGSKAWTITMT